MHELSLVGAIVDTAREVLAAEGATRLVSVRLRLGLLSCARAESLRQVFPLASRGTPMEGARLDIELAPLTLECRSCGARTSRAEIDLRCERCGGVDVRVIEGRDLLIDSMEVS